MRILHIIYDDIENPWVGGGGAARTLEIYSRIVRMGHKVVVVCGNYPGAPLRQARRGIIYRHVGAARPYAWSRLTFMLGAMRLIKRGGYDIVIEDVSPFSPVGAPMWCGQTPAIASVQNLSGSHAISKYGLLGWGPRLAERPLVSLFKNFVAVSPGIAKQLKARFGSINIRVIPNSVGQGFLEAAATQEGPAAEGRYILSLGRIDIYQKGLDRLIAAFGLVADQSPATRLIIAGDGAPSQVDALRSLVAGSRHASMIKLAGKVEQAEAATLMRGAVLLAMPSRYEAWPLAAIEAGAVGTPVVGSNIVGVRDAAPQFPEAHGELVPEGDIEALTRSMLKMLVNHDLRHEMGERGRRWAARFTWDALAQEQCAFYEELITRNINFQTAEAQRP
ncbi:MAG TPA: glycosyltransferase family 4 protein [Chloroflexia bacterium]|nr:glycosyltransferase family 4 protein [Chloroflexia bacterium]